MTLLFLLDPVITTLYNNVLTASCCVSFFFFSLCVIEVMMDCVMIDNHQAFLSELCFRRRSSAVDAHAYISIKYLCNVTHMCKCVINSTYSFEARYLVKTCQENQMNSLLFSARYGTYQEWWEKDFLQTFLSNIDTGKKKKEKNKPDRVSPVYRAGLGSFSLRPADSKLSCRDTTWGCSSDSTSLETLVD